MGELEVLNGQLNSCKKQLKNINTSIRKLENELESLRSFKSCVETSQGNFSYINQKRLYTTEDLQNIKERCLSAKEYLNGTKNTLNGIGSKIVGVTFSGLEILISAKIASCNTKILALETQAGAINASVLTLEKAKRALAE